MGKYLFYNNSVVFSTEEGVETLPTEEFAGTAMAEDHNAHILIVESEGAAMVERVRAVRRIFPGNGIRTLVSYAAALRVFLAGKHLIAGADNCLVVDDLGGVFLLTALTTGQGASTRVISFQDPVKVVIELKRTQKNVMEKIAAPQRSAHFRVLTNNEAVVNALGAEEQRSAVFFKEMLPVFEVLGRERFHAQLMAPEDVLVERRKQNFRELMLSGCISFSLMGIGLGPLFFVGRQESLVNEKLIGLEKERKAADEDLGTLTAMTSDARLRDLAQAGYLKVFDAFVSGIPPGARLERVLFKRGMDEEWQFTGTISFPKQDVLAFMGQGILAGANSVHVFVDGRHGLRVEKKIRG